MASKYESFFKPTSEHPGTPNQVAGMLKKWNNIFKPKYEKFQAKFATGDNTVRYLPAHPESTYDFILTFQTYKYDNLPETIKPASLIPDRIDTDPFEKFRKWVYTSKFRKYAYVKEYKNTPEEKTALNLNPAKRGISWIIQANTLMGNDPDKIPLQIQFGSAADGSFGGQLGIMTNIYALTQQKDTDPTSATHNKLLYGAIYDLESGHNITITKKGNGTNTNYTLIPTKQASSVDHLIDLMEQKHPGLFKDTYCPLEETLFIPTDEELLNLLKRYCASKNYAHIFNAFLTEELGQAPDAPPVVITTTPKEETPTQPTITPVATTPATPVKTDENEDEKALFPQQTTPATTNPVKTTEPAINKENANLQAITQKYGIKNTDVKSRELAKNMLYLEQRATEVQVDMKQGKKTTRKPEDQTNYDAAIANFAKLNKVGKDLLSTLSDFDLWADS
jgi:hypothetical protein